MTLDIQAIRSQFPALVRVLNALYSPRRDDLPADGRRARRHLDAAARWLKGTVEADSSAPSVARN